MGSFFRKKFSIKQNDDFKLTILLSKRYCTGSNPQNSTFSVAFRRKRSPANHLTYRYLAKVEWCNTYVEIIVLSVIELVILWIPIIFNIISTSFVNFRWIISPDQIYTPIFCENSASGMFSKIFCYLTNLGQNKVVPTVWRKKHIRLKHCRTSWIIFQICRMCHY